MNVFSASIFFFSYLIYSNVANGVVAFYEVPDYRCVEDSPFYGLDDFYLEDFEDGLLNIPNVTSSSGYVMQAGDVRSVDCDDGVIDGISKSFGSFVSAGGIAPFHRFEFSPDSLGRFPNFVGIVVTQEWSGLINSPFDTLSALSATGGNLPNGSLGFFVNDLITESNNPGNVEHAKFVGLYWSAGISGFLVSRALQVDHLQFSYAVPEPDATFLCAFFVLCALLRRRRERKRIL